MSIKRTIGGEGDEGIKPLIPDSKKGRVGGRTVELLPISLWTGDILRSIFSFVSVKNLPAIRLVCRGWNRAIVNEPKWEPLRKYFERAKILFPESAIGNIAPLIERGGAAYRICQRPLAQSWRAWGYLNDKLGASSELLCYDTHGKDSQCSLIDIEKKETHSFPWEDFLKHADLDQRRLVNAFIEERLNVSIQSGNIQQSHLHTHNMISLVGGRYLVLLDYDKSIIVLQKDQKPVIFFPQTKDEGEERPIHFQIIDAGKLLIQTRHCLEYEDSTLKYAVHFYILDLAHSTLTLLKTHTFCLSDEELFPVFQMCARDGMAAVQTNSDRISVFYQNQQAILLKKPGDRAIELFDVSGESVYAWVSAYPNKELELHLYRYHMNEEGIWTADQIALPQVLKTIKSKYLPVKPAFILLKPHFLLAISYITKPPLGGLQQILTVWNLQTGKLNLLRNPPTGERFERQGVLVGDYFIFAADRKIYGVTLAHPKDTPPFLGNLLGEVPDPILSFFLFKDDLVVQTAKEIFVFPVIAPNPQPITQTD